MSTPRKYPAELRERATRLALEARADPTTRVGAYKRIGEQLGVHPEALRTWVRESEVDEGLRAGTTSSDATRIAELERENRELRRANAILKQASAFFASVPDCGPAGLALFFAVLRWLFRDVPSGRTRPRCAWGVRSLEQTFGSVPMTVLSAPPATAWNPR